MSEATILFVHGRQVIGAAAQRVLEAHGFRVSVVHTAAAARSSLERGPGAEAFAGGSPGGTRPWSALVVEVALPDSPGYELIPVARAARVEVVVLVASVYRRTSYKRRPSRLYGADDYVEIHHLGDHLPQRLRSRLGLAATQGPEAAVREAYEALQREGDARMAVETPEALASLIVADLLLYNGELVADAETPEATMRAIAHDLDGARKLFMQVSNADPSRDLIGEAFRRQLEQMEASR